MQTNERGVKKRWKEVEIEEQEEDEGGEAYGCKSEEEKGEGQLTGEDEEYHGVEKEVEGCWDGWDSWWRRT